MEGPGFFYRLNNLLLVIFIVLVAFMLYSKKGDISVYSQNTPDSATNSSGSQFRVINREAKVTFDIPSFTVHFLSDGFTDGIDRSRAELFTPGKGPYSAIPIPVEFSFNPDASILLMPGEIVFPAIQRTSAPLGFQCVERGSPLDNKLNQENCFFNVTMYALYTDTISTSIRLGEREIKYRKDKTKTEDQGNIFTKLLDLLVNIDYQLGKVLVDSGAVDQSRNAVGVVRMWGDDELQQIVKVTPSEGRILVLKAGIESTGVNVSEGLFANDLNPVLRSDTVVAYKQPNVLRKNFLEKIFNITPSETLGAGEIYDPFTNKPDDQQQNKSFTQILTEGIFNFLTGSGTIGVSKQEKLAAQVPIRTIQETSSYSVKYSLCDAFSFHSGLFSYLRDYPNPIPKPAKKYLQDGKTVDPQYIKWENYEGLSSKTKRCIDGISKHVNDGVARGCALKLADDPGAGCDEFTVEEDDLNFGFMDYTFPVGLGAYFQNSYLNTINPTLKGPYLNYLSNNLCARLNISLNLKAGVPYIYHVGTAGGASSSIRDSQGRVLSADVVNQYCILGGVLSNFSWAMTQQLKYFSSRPSDRDLFSLPREAFTCDKKEIAYFGGELVQTNIPTVNGEPVYITGDNVRGGRSGTREELVIWHGYEAYPLTKILHEELKDRYLYEYRNFRLHVLNDANSRRPKYALLLTQNKNKDLLIWYLCKLPSRLLHDSLDKSNTRKKYCVEVLQGRFVLVYASALAKHEGLDAVTIVFNKFGGKGEVVTPQYRYIYVTDENDLSQSIISDSYYLLDDRGKDPVFEGFQLQNGSLAVSYIRDGFKEIGAYLLNPFSGVGIEKDPSGKVKIVTRKPEDGRTRLTNNLCESYRNYCDYFASRGFIAKLEIVEAPSGAIFMSAVVPGKGIIFPVDPTGTVKSLKPYIFGFKRSTDPDTSNYENISAIRVDNSGDFHIFLGQSGDYLRVLTRESIRDKNIADQVSKVDIGGIRCDNNCLASIQLRFDTSQFMTDCSDYNGSGVCGAPRLNKLGPPIVQDFEFTSYNDIRARYTHSGLGKTLLESWDYLYSMTGVYSRVGGEDSTEVSNVYIPGDTDAQPIRYFNASNGGLQIGVDVEPTVGGYKEKLLFNSLGSNISTTFRGFNRTKKLEKIECLREYSQRTSSVDLFYQIYGLEPISMNVLELQDRNISSSSPGASSSSLGSKSPSASSPVNSGAFSSNNSGEYCEETWCIPDEVQFVGGSEFTTDTNNKDLKNKIAEFIRDGKNKRSYIDKMCAIASMSQVSCAFVAAIWVAESSASIVESPRNPAFGCFLNESSYCKTTGANTDYCINWYTFENQVKCAVNSLTRLYNEAKRLSPEKRILRGPSDRVGKPFLTNTMRGGGTCKAGTIFSYVMQKYTPIDRRINNDNQCNQGLVRRDGQDKFCTGILPASSTRNSERVSYLPDVWGEAIITRPNIQKTLLQIDQRLRADNNRCYPNSLIGETDKPLTNKNIDAVLDQYDLSWTEKVGEVRLGLYNWGSGEAAGNVYMALRMLNNGKLEGVHVIPPGGEFSFNDTIGNPTANDVNKLWAQLQNIQVPWNKGQKFKRDGSTVIGGGWCDLATGIRMAAEEVRGNDGTKLGVYRFTDRNTIQGMSVPSSSVGDGTGYYGHIAHWTHTGENTYQSYNKLKTYGDGIDRTKFVSIWTNPANSQGINDGDLVIRNPYTRESGIDMIITISLDDQGSIKIQSMFGRKKS
jgi:hypothetical protein